MKYSVGEDVAITKNIKDLNDACIFYFAERYAGQKTTIKEAFFDGENTYKLNIDGGIRNFYENLLCKPSELEE